MKSKLSTLGLVLILSTLIFSGCAPTTPQPTPVPPTPTPIPPTPTPKPPTSAGEIARSDMKRVTSPDVAASDLADLVSGNSAFTFDLYQALGEGNGNLFYSPYSISLALAMTYAGARGETERQMADTLHFILSQDGLHPAFNGLDLELARRSEGPTGQEGEGTRPGPFVLGHRTGPYGTVPKDQGRRVQGFQLHIANSLWGQIGYTFLSEYLDLLAENYGAGLRLLDFASAREESRVTINDWVSEQTEDRIKDLIPSGGISELTRLVLANAIYFNAAWQYPFKEKQTHDGTFHLLDGSEVTVPMMKQTESFGYAEGEAYQAVELPYVGGELAMVILLPEAGGFEAFQSSLDAEWVDAILKDLAHKRVALTMPKFTFDSSFMLANTLAGLGMRDAFSRGAADFSGMDGSREFFIGEVIHKAFVSVDEAGTEAAAATAVIMVGAAPGTPVPPIEVTVDRPFVFLIRDIKTGAILFVGRVVNPSA